MYATYEGKISIDLGNERGRWRYWTVTDGKTHGTGRASLFERQIIEPKIAIGGIFYVEQQGYVELYMPKGTVNEDGSITVGDYEKVTPPKNNEYCNGYFIHAFNSFCRRGSHDFLPRQLFRTRLMVGNYVNGIAAAPEYTVGNNSAEPNLFFMLVRLS